MIDALELLKEIEATERETSTRGTGNGSDKEQSQAADQRVSLADFYAYMPMHSYLFAPSREPWPDSSVNARIPPIPIFDASGQPVIDKNGNQKTITAATWLDRNQPVEQMTWAPGRPMIIRDRLISDGGWIERQGVSCFNLYRPPIIEQGDAAQAGPWLEHVHKIYPNDADHIIKWLAHRVRRPHEKINHALVLMGPQGIGKDTLLEPVKRRVGPWNFHFIEHHRVWCGEEQEPSRCRRPREPGYPHRLLDHLVGAGE
jgi:hypothetical protein